MLDPKVDVDNFIEEFGIELTWFSNTEEIDAQTGSPIDSFKTKKIKVILTERSRMERILDAGRIDEEILLMYSRADDNVQVNDKVRTPNGIEYKVTKLASESVFTDKSSEISFSTAGRQFEIVRIVGDA